MARPKDLTVRPRLLDAADRLLSRIGFRRMTIAQVAEEAGVGKGSVYLHFPSKDEVALACIDRMAEDVLAHLRIIAAGSGSAPERLSDALRARVLMRFDYAREHANSIDEKLAAMRQPMLERRAAQFRAEASVLKVILAQGANAGKLRPGGSAEAASLVTATNSLLPYSLSVRELGRRSEIVRRTDSLVALLLAGLRPTRTPGTRRKPHPRRTNR